VLAEGKVMTPATRPPEKIRPLSRGPERTPFAAVWIPSDELDSQNFPQMEISLPPDWENLPLSESSKIFAIVH
jgi:hypothetical protein